MMLGKYKRLVRELQETGQTAVIMSEPNSSPMSFYLQISGLKMLEAAREFKALLEYFERAEDDGK